MDSTIKPAWLAMSLDRLARHLTAKKYPLPLIRTIVETVRTEKAKRKSSRIKMTAAQQLWHDIINAARMELNGVRTLKSQLKRRNEDGYFNDPKHTALAAYEDVLVDVVARLRKLEKAGEYTPSQFAALLHREKGRDIPNEGEHWTDWVSDSNKKRVRDLFNATPDPVRGKKKRPFERRITQEEHTIARSYLTDQLNKAEQELNDMLAITKDPVQVSAMRAQLLDVHHAVHILDQKKRTDPLPARWQSLIR